MTTPQLLAAFRGDPVTPGPSRCFWCAAPCDDRHRFKRSDGFTGWSDVRCPSSRVMCGGCAFATDESDRSRRPRMLSWVVAADGLWSGFKDGIDHLRAVLLDPPPPPFSVVVAVSGQKHLLYRCPVNRSRDVVTVQLELETVTFRPKELADRLRLAGSVAAACGKPPLLDGDPAGMAVALSSYYRDPGPALAWLDVRGEPLSRLAAFICANMENSKRDHPTDHHSAVGRRPVGLPAAAPDVRRRRVPAATGGADGPGLFG